MRNPFGASAAPWRGRSQEGVGTLQCTASRCYSRVDDSKDAAPPATDRMLELSTLLGRYPVTAALRDGDVASPRVALRFADEARPATAFKRVVRDLEFDVAELAIMTFLMAKAYGKPLVL